MKPKVLIVGLVGIIVLFVVTLAMGGSQSAGSAEGQQKGFVKQLGGRLSQTSLVPRSAVDVQGCGSNDKTTVIFGGTCVLVVTSHWKDMRLLRMQFLNDSGSLRVSAPPPRGDIDEVEGEVKAGKEIRVGIGKGGSDRKTTITLTCAAGLTTKCRVRLLDVDE